MSAVTIVHPVTGAPLLAGASLSNCYLLIASQIFTYDIPRTSEQNTPALLEPLVLDAQNFALGISMLTHATKGQVSRIEVSGNPHSGRVLKVT